MMFVATHDWPIFSFLKLLSFSVVFYVLHARGLRTSEKWLLATEEISRDFLFMYSFFCIKIAALKKLNTKQCWIILLISKIQLIQRTCPNMLSNDGKWTFKEVLRSVVKKRDRYETSNCIENFMRAPLKMGKWTNDSLKMELLGPHSKKYHFSTQKPRLKN